MLRPFWLELALLLAALAALFAFLPHFKPQNRIIVILMFFAAAILTVSNGYLKSRTGAGIEDIIICTILSSGNWCLDLKRKELTPQPSIGNSTVIDKAAQIEIG